MMPVDDTVKLELERGSLTKLISRPSQILNIIDYRHESILNLTPGPHFLEIYDGVDASYREFKSLDLFDILLSVAMNSKIDTAAKIASVYSELKESSVQDYLEKLAALSGADFHQMNDFWGTPLVEMFVDICVRRPVRYAGLSSFSKIVHPKFPGLIPILDPLFTAFYGAEPIGQGMPPEKAGEFKIRLTELFDKVKGDIKNNLSILEEVRWGLVNMTSGRLNLSILRIWNLIIWDYQAHTVNLREKNPSSEDPASKGWVETDPSPGSIGT